MFTILLYLAAQHACLI